MRLIKHWNRTHQKPLFSWHIKVLALGSVQNEMSQMEALIRWFEYAHATIKNGPTPDPAGVCKPIDVEEGTKSDVLRKLMVAKEGLIEAARLEEKGWHVLAKAKLARVFNDENMLPKPSEDSIQKEKSRKIQAEARRPHTAVNPIIPPVRSWSEQ